MEIVYIDIQDAINLFDVYNQQLASVPYCYPVSPDEFAEGVIHRRNPSNPHAEIHSEKIIVCKQNRKTLGFAHVSVGEIKNFGERKSGGFIHFLTYKTGCRRIGQAVLEECEKYLIGLSSGKIWAFQNASNYRFYHFGFGYLSDRMCHLYALFRMNNYQTDIGEIFMNQVGYSVDETVCKDKRIEIVVERKHGRGVLPGLHVKAIRNGEQIGECISVSGGEFCLADEVQDWFMTKWLGVEEEYQGKGLGRYLLQRTLREMRNIGYKNAVISANVKNFRAQLFYTNYGYQIVDTNYGLVKSFEEGEI